VNDSVGNQHRFLEEVVSSWSRKGHVLSVVVHIEAEARSSVSNRLVRSSEESRKESCSVGDEDGEISGGIDPKDGDGFRGKLLGSLLTQNLSEVRCVSDVLVGTECRRDQNVVQLIEESHSSAEQFEGVFEGTLKLV
jgi:hypothetical protein